MRPQFVVALCLALLATVASLFVPRGSTRQTPSPTDPVITAELKVADALATRDLPAAQAAVGRLKIPADFHPSRSGCQGYRCYIVAKRPARVVPELLSTVGQLHPDKQMPEPIQAMARRLAQEVHDPRFARSGRTQYFRCLRVLSPRHGVVENCTYYAEIDNNALTVIMGPYTGCPARCHWTNKTEIIVDLGGLPAPPLGT